jgi:hypothetical protein
VAKKKPVRRRRGVSIKDRLFALEEWVRLRNGEETPRQLRLLCARVLQLEDEREKKARRRSR